MIGMREGRAAMEVKLMGHREGFFGRVRGGAGLKPQFNE